MKRKVTSGIFLTMGVMGLLFSGSRVEAEPLHDAQPVQVLTAGKAALEDHLFELAEKDFQTFLKKSSSRNEKAEGTFLLAQALYGQKRYPETAALLVENKKSGQHKTWRNRYAWLLAQTYYALEAYEKAYEALKKTEEDHSDVFYRAGLRLLAQIHLALDRSEEALELFEDFHASYPDVMEAPTHLLDWAAVLIEEKREEEAEDVLRKLLESHPDSMESVRGRLWLSGILLKKGWRVMRIWEHALKDGTIRRKLGAIKNHLESSNGDNQGTTSGQVLTFHSQ